MLSGADEAAALKQDEAAVLKQVLFGRDVIVVQGPRRTAARTSSALDLQSCY